MQRFPELIAEVWAWWRAGSKAKEHPVLPQWSGEAEGAENKFHLCRLCSLAPLRQTECPHGRQSGYEFCELPWAHPGDFRCQAGLSWGLGRIAAIWRGVCIIRSKFLNRITDAYRTNAGLANLMLDPFFKDVLSKTQQNWREVVSIATQNGIPVPAFSVSLAYYDSYHAVRLPADLLQAQRDFFGARTRMSARTSLRARCSIRNGLR